VIILPLSMKGARDNRAGEGVYRAV
jgi:hypothetical protein